MPPPPDRRRHGPDRLAARATCSPRRSTAHPDAASSSPVLLGHPADGALGCPRRHVAGTPRRLRCRRRLLGGVPGPLAAISLWPLPGRAALARRIWRRSLLVGGGDTAVRPQALPAQAAYARSASSIVYPILPAGCSMGGSCGLPVVETPLWGGLFLTLVISIVGIVASLPIGIVLALGRRSKLPVIKSFCVTFIEIVRGVPLVTVLFMASVMLPLFLPPGCDLRQAAAGPDRRRAVLGRLHGRGGARRPAGDPQGPVRGRRRRWASATGRRRA